MDKTRFYESPDLHNIIKTKIVTKYFVAWTNFMLPRLKGPGDLLAYVDLFAGPGKFENGEASTPLSILNYTVGKPALASHLITRFNDKNFDYAEQLQIEIDALPGIDNLRYPPEVSNVAIGNQLVVTLRNLRLVPTLFFIDPWGYKGLSLDLIGTAIKSWGCDCIFFSTITVSILRSVTLLSTNS